MTGLFRALCACVVYTLLIGGSSPAVFFLRFFPRLPDTVRLVKFMVRVRIIEIRTVKIAA